MAANGLNVVAVRIATIWGDGTTSSSDGQFFRSAKRGDAAGDINARYGHDPDVSFYTLPISMAL